MAAGTSRFSFNLLKIRHSNSSKHSCRADFDMPAAGQAIFLIAGFNQSRDCQTTKIGRDARLFIIYAYVSITLAKVSTTLQYREAFRGRMAWETARAHAFNLDESGRRNGEKDDWAKKCIWIR